MTRSISGGLKAAIQAAYCLPSTDKIRLSLDSEGLQGLSGTDATLLASLGVAHGTQLYLRGRLHKTVATKSFVTDAGAVVSKGQETFDILPSEEDEEGEGKEGEGKEEGEMSAKAAAAQSVFTPTATQAHAQTEAEEQAAAVAAAAEFQFFEDEQAAPSPLYCPPASASSPEVRRPDENQRMRLVDDSPPARPLPSPFRNADLSRSLLRDISMQQMLHEIDAAVGRAGHRGGQQEQAGASSQSAAAADIQSRAAAALGLHTHTSGGRGSSSSSSSSSSRGRGSSSAHPAASASASASSSAASGGYPPAPDLDMYGNPPGTSYCGSMGSSARFPLRLDDVEGEEDSGMAMADEGGAGGLSRVLPRGTAAAETDTAPVAAAPAIDEGVAEALRAAGYSEYDILLELKAHEDEALARQLQGQGHGHGQGGSSIGSDSGSGWGGGQGSASPLAQLLRQAPAPVSTSAPAPAPAPAPASVFASSSAYSYSSSSSAPRTHHHHYQQQQQQQQQQGQGHERMPSLGRDPVSQNLFSNMYSNGDALSRLQAQAEQALIGARSLGPGGGGGEGEGEGGDEDEDDLRALRMELDRLSARVAGAGRAAVAVAGVGGDRDEEEEVGGWVHVSAPPAAAAQGGDAPTGSRLAAVRRSLQEQKQEDQEENDRDLAMALEASLQEAGHKAAGQGRGSHHSNATAPGNPRLRPAPAAFNPSASASASASSLNNEAAIEQARLRLVTLMNTPGGRPSPAPSPAPAPAAAPTTQRRKQPDARAGAPTLSAGSRAQIASAIGGGGGGEGQRARDSKSTGLRSAVRSGGGSSAYEMSRGGATTASSRSGAGAVGAAAGLPSNITAAERERNRSGRRDRSNTRSELYRDVESFLQEDLAGGVRSRAAVIDLTSRNAYSSNYSDLGGGSSSSSSSGSGSGSGRAAPYPSSRSSRGSHPVPDMGGEDDDDLARAIAASLAER